MSPVDINVPTRSALVPKTKDSFVSLLTNLKYNKNNVFMQLVMYVSYKRRLWKGVHRDFQNSLTL